MSMKQVFVYMHTLLNLQSLLILAEKLIRKQIHLFISVFANMESSTVIQMC